jgi:hypothetical protein
VISSASRAADDRDLAVEAAPAPYTRTRRSRAAFLGWCGVVTAVLAVASLAFAVLQPEPAPRSHDPVRTIGEHGSIAAIDHRDQQAVALRTALTHTVAEHGSITAIENRDRAKVAAGSERWGS